MASNQLADENSIKQEKESNTVSIDFVQDHQDLSEVPWKRQAQKGQWETPPVPVFPSVASLGSGDVGAIQYAGLSNASIGEVFLPTDHSSDDITKALQEAYRRGQEAYLRSAEVAVVLNQDEPIDQANVHLPHFKYDSFDHNPMNVTSSDVDMKRLISATSCPDFSIPPIYQSLHVDRVSSSSSPPNASAIGQTLGTSYSGSLDDSVIAAPNVIPSPLLATSGHHTNIMSLTMAPQPIAMGVVPTPILTSGIAVASSTTKNPLAIQIHPTNVTRDTVPVTRLKSSMLTGSASLAKGKAVTTSAVDGVSHPFQCRSVSLPDISTYAAKVSADEQKRLKRLERNRASARLRRLRKKNLVDSYEVEVGLLEASLTKLQAHRWGIGADHESLFEALSMDRGQQVIDTEKRKELITSILTQQRDQVRSLMECQMESMILGLVGQSSRNEAGYLLETQIGSDQDLAEIVSELDDVLQLTAEQKRQLEIATTGCEEEYRASQTVDSCLAAMLSSHWLMNQSIEECTKPFTSILNQGQISKFLLWADHNSEAIEQLDFVNAPPSNAAPAQGPIFVFGVNDSGQGDDFEES